MAEQINLHGKGWKDVLRRGVHRRDAQDCLWAVIYIRGGEEQAILSRCGDLGCELYTPMGKVNRKQGKETIVVDRPVFSGYMFVSQTGKWLNVLQDPSVWYLLMSNDETVTIKPEYITQIKQLELQGAFNNLDTTLTPLEAVARAEPVVPPKVVQKLAKLRNDQSVEVTEGPFKGIQGIVLQSKKHNQVLIETEGRRIQIPRAILVAI